MVTLSPIYCMNENEQKPTAVFSYNLLKYDRTGLLLETTGKILRLGSRFTYALKFTLALQEPGMHVMKNDRFLAT